MRKYFCRHLHSSPISMDQFHQHLWCQSRAAFAPMICNAFKGNSIWQKCTKIWCLRKSVSLKHLIKISAELLVKQNNIFCIIVPAALHIAHTRLYHAPKGITNPKNKFMHFLTVNFFCKEKKAQAFNRDRCCHLALCLHLILFHWSVKLTPGAIGRIRTHDFGIMSGVFHHCASGFPMELKVIIVYYHFYLIMRRRERAQYEGCYKKILHCYS